MSVFQPGNSFARLCVSEDEVRAIHEKFSGLPDVIDYVGAVECELGGGVTMSVSMSPLPHDLSFWKFDRFIDPIFLGTSTPYSEVSLREELRRGGESISVTHWCEYSTFTVRFCRMPGGIQVQAGFFGDFTIQESLKNLKHACQSPVWNRRVEVNWRLNYPSFVPCLTNKDSGEVMELSFLVKSEDEAIRLSTTLGELCGTPPRSIGRSEEISREELSDYVRLRKKLTSQHPMWAYTLTGTYADGFDPIIRPKKIHKEGWRFPLLEKRFQKGVSAVGTDVRLIMVHQPEGSYLELMSARGPDALREWTGQFPKLKWEYWSGCETERWDGDATPVKLPEVKPAPALMFKTELDRQIPCFIDERVLTIFIDWSASWAHRQKYTPEKLRHKRQDDLGYTNEECDHLGRIDMIEARFDELAARYTEWDSIRFWWPHTGDKAYWKKRPNLKGVKTLPMKVRGKKLQIPVEFVEPLKCPM